MPHIERLLEELTNAYGPSGFEGPVRAIMQREMSPLADHMETDGLGSLISVLRGNSEAPRIMMAAHMDEVGLMVKYITPEGYIKFQPLGGWLDQALINQRWMLLTRLGTVYGVTGLKTIHVMLPEERKQVFKKEQMFLDVGATSRKDAEDRLGIRPGDPIAPDSRFTVLNGGKLYLAKAWDDRVGLAVMVEVMRSLKDSLPPNTVYAVSTTQEEVGLRGAGTSAFAIQPDVGIAIDTTLCVDTPGVPEDQSVTRQGAGAALTVMDSSFISDLDLYDQLEAIAKRRKITTQRSILPRGGTDSGTMQRAGSGARVLTLSCPTRYIHTVTEMVHLDDLHACRDLLGAYLAEA